MELPSIVKTSMVIRSVLPFLASHSTGRDSGLLSGTVTKKAAESPPLPSEHILFYLTSGFSQKMKS